MEVNKRKLCIGFCILYLNNFWSLLCFEMKFKVEEVDSGSGQWKVFEVEVESGKWCLKWKWKWSF